MGFLKDKWPISGYILQVGAWKHSFDNVQEFSGSDYDDGAPTIIRKNVRTPICFLRELVRMHSKPGDVVLEWACGSAPTLRACLLEGRICLGLDNDRRVVVSVRNHMMEFRKWVLSKLPAFVTTTTNPTSKATSSETDHLELGSDSDTETESGKKEAEGYDPTGDAAMYEEEL